MKNLFSLENLWVCDREPFFPALWSDIFFPVTGSFCLALGTRLCCALFLSSLDCDQKSLVVMLCTVLLLLCFNLFQYSIYLSETPYLSAHGLFVFSYIYIYIYTHFNLISYLACVVAFLCFLGVNSWGPYLFWTNLFI